MCREELKLKKESKPESMTIHAQFESYCGWAVFTIIPSLGVLTIMSDWGNACHRWPVAKDLGGFVSELLRFNPEYIMRKFAYEKKDSWEEEVDIPGTRRRMLQSLAEGASVESDAEKAAYRDSVTNVLALVASLDNYSPSKRSGVTMALTEAPGELWDDFGGELYEYVVYEPSHNYLFWQHTLIPWFQDHLRETL
jgi:hypothetical protein